MKRVLLTGGCGFVGAHAVEHWLTKTDWHLIVMEGLRHAGDISRLTDSRVFNPERVTVVWHDLRAPIYDNLARRIGEVDYIVNMASDSHVDRSITDPVPFILNNVNLALTVLEFARKAKPEKYIQIGTDEVFGPAPEGVSFKEEDPFRPSNPYSASKAAQDIISYAYWRTYKVPVILTRTMNQFGERQNPEKFVPMVIRQVLNGEIVTIHGQPLQDQADPTDPSQWLPGSRVWLHARNHADALGWILDNIEPVAYGSAEDPARFNIAGEQEIDNLALARRVAKILDKPLKFRMVDFHSSRPGHDLRYSLDGSKLREAGWDQPMTLDESFERTVRWVAKNEV